MERLKGCRPDRTARGPELPFDRTINCGDPEERVGAMDRNQRNAWVLIGSTVAGGVGGGIVGSRLAAAFGLAAGPWGTAAGAVLGALAGASVASLVVGEVEFPTPEQRRGRRPSLTSGA
jgi:hypothetical protein